MRKYLHLLILALGVLLGGAGWRLTYFSDVQAIEYNRGRDYYRTGDLANAALAFEKSFNAYDRARGQTTLDAWLYPAPQRRFGALARFYRADIFFDMQQPEQALKELVVGLRTNPGELDLSGIPPSQIAALLAEQCDMAIDVELLFMSNPELAQQAGAGDGKDKNKKPGGDKPGAAGRDPNDPRNSTQPGMPTSIDDI